MRKFRIGPMFTPPARRHAAAPSQSGGAKLGRRASIRRPAICSYARPMRRSQPLAKNDGPTRWWPSVVHVFARVGESVTLPGGIPLVSAAYAVLTAID